MGKDLSKVFETSREQKEIDQLLCTVFERALSQAFEKIGGSWVRKHEPGGLVVLQDREDKLKLTAGNVNAINEEAREIILNDIKPRSLTVGFVGMYSEPGVPRDNAVKFIKGLSPEDMNGVFNHFMPDALKRFCVVPEVLDAPEV